MTNEPESRKLVLVVDDEQTLVTALRYTLQREGYRVISASDGEAALETARASRPDLIILDLMLPVMDGLQVCRVLRKEMNTPILMLTAKAEEVDKVVGLEVGADDYLTKPFGMRELVARIHALLRRSEHAQSEPRVLIVGDLQVDLDRREASRNGLALRLKPKEFDLLRYLMTNKGRLLTRNQLLNAVWGYDFLGDSRTVDVHVRWLREKIEDEPGKPTRLLTLRGAGYRFEG